MGSPRRGPERDDNEIWWHVGPMLAVALALLFFPALLAGVMVGGAVGRFSPRARRADREALKQRRGTGWSLLVAGAVIGAIYAVLVATGPLAGEIERFLGAWRPPGGTLLHPTTLIDPTALKRFPWGWLPIASAIGLVTAGVLIVFRNRR